MTSPGTRGDLERRAGELAAAGTPFVAATVARAARPASVRPGDRALVLADGRIEGFVGGACAEAAVRLHAARALETGEPLLIRILPGDEDAPAEDGAVTVRNPCLSGGALEIFLEPRLPAPGVVVVGDTPVAHALVGLGQRLGYDVARAGDDELLLRRHDIALVVASHGRDEERPLAAALTEHLPYVGLVASRTRGGHVVGALREAGVAEPQLARLRTPAGLDIGARGPEEIALSILAEIVATLRARPVAAEVAGGDPQFAVDPVCGMEVPAAEESEHVDHDGRRVWFCGPGCRRAFADAPARYAGAA